MSNLIVYNASAGSGKTFTLIIEYVNLLIDINIEKNIHEINKGVNIGNTFKYRNILAVTFTNKATSELKQRLISLLYGLSKNACYVEKEMEKLISLNNKYTTKIISLSAREALRNILHDYSNLYIETIDSFFQRVVKNMSKELGINPRYNVIIDDTEITNQAFEIIIEKTKDNISLRNWYFNKISEKIQDGKRWNIQDDVLSFSRELNKEKFKIIEDELFDNIGIDSLEKYRKEILEKKQKLEKEIESLVNKFKDSINNKGLNAESFRGKTRSPAVYVLKILDNDYSGIYNKSVKDATLDYKTWFGKDESDENLIFAKNTLTPIIIKILEILENKNTCDIVLKNISNLGFLLEISILKRSILKDNNLFLLSETSNLLAKMIGNQSNSDTSFIFEKIGTQLRHIMIDEFQDTSSLNFKNFKNLISESYDNHFRSIIVGDIKQSIYRFNNGDWRLLGNISKGLTPDNPLLKRQPDIINLSVNYRSDKNIIEFNNNIFPFLKLYFDKSIEELDKDSKNEIYKVFENTIQYPNRKENNGIIRYFEIEDKDDIPKGHTSLERLIKEIEYYQDKGLKSSDICILLRTNKEIKLVSDYIYNYKRDNPNSKYSYDVVSDEAFEFSSSNSIELIISALKYIEDEKDIDSLIKLKLNYQPYQDIFSNDISQIPKLIDNIKFLEDRVSLKRKPLNELVLYIINNLELGDNNSSFIYSFLDSLQEFYIQGDSSILNFLKYWEDNLSKKSILISSSIDGIRLMSIHKAKGLEFPVCIIPFPSWKLNDTKGNINWVESPKGFESIPYLPIEIKKELENSYFNKEYNEEITQIFIDNLNILYVALTRGVNALSIINIYENKKDIKFGIGHNVGELLNIIISNNSYFSKIRSQEEWGSLYEINGSIFIKNKEKENQGFLPKENRLDIRLVKSQAKIKFSQTLEAERFVKSLIDDGDIINIESSISPKLRGNILHKVLSKIYYEYDKEKVLNQILLEGEITHDLKSQILSIIDSMIEEKKEWFDIRNKVLNERSIVYKKDYIRISRPDRVLEIEDKIIIIDYKFSVNKKGLQAYENQIKSYAKLYYEMGYNKIDSYLWFVNYENNKYNSEIIKVI